MFDCPKVKALDLRMDDAGGRGILAQRVESPIQSARLFAKSRVGYREESGGIRPVRVTLHSRLVQLIKRSSANYNDVSLVRGGQANGVSRAESEKQLQATVKFRILVL